MDIDKLRERVKEYRNLCLNGGGTPEPEYEEDKLINDLLQALEQSEAENKRLHKILNEEPLV